MIKKYLAAVVGLLAVPGMALAVNDVTLTTDTVLSVGGVTFNVTGSSATISQIVVNSTNFVLTLDADSSVTVTTADHSRIDEVIADSTKASASGTCSSGLSTETYTATDNTTITVSPTGILCSSGSAYVSSPTPPAPSGGGSPAPAVTTSSVPAVTPAVTPATTVPPVVNVPEVPAIVNASPSPVAMLVSPVFNRALSLGQNHSDAKRLQQLLNSDPDTQVAKSGAGSPGRETSLFGPATKSAVMKFQVKYGVAKPGQVGYGLFGPATRAKMAEVFGEGVSVPSVSAPASAMSTATKLELIKTLLAKILELQAQLRAMQQ